MRRGLAVCSTRRTSSNLRSRSLQMWRWITPTAAAARSRASRSIRRASSRRACPSSRRRWESLLRSSSSVRRNSVRMSLSAARTFRPNSSFHRGGGSALPSTPLSAVRRSRSISHSRGCIRRRTPRLSSWRQRSSSVRIRALQRQHCVWDCVQCAIPRVLKSSRRRICPSSSTVRTTLRGCAPCVRDWMRIFPICRVFSCSAS